MFLELIATIVAGFAGAGLMLLAVKLTKGALPRWLVPVAAGAAMLAAAISGEYGWYGRTRAALPDGLVVAHTVESRSALRPWTYLYPFTNRFVAVDRAGLQQNANNPDLFMADLYFYGRWRPTQAVQMQVDCAGNRRADPMEGRSDSAPVWRQVSPDDPILKAVCERG